MSNSNIFDNLIDYENECLEALISVDGNISVDPRFCDTAAGDYTLAANSPCAGAGTAGGDIGAFPVECGPTHVPPGNQLVPLTYSLSQNYPNPFNPWTSIAFSLPGLTEVTIEVFNVLGQSVTILLDEQKEPGTHIVIWKGENDRHQPVASGVYFYRIKAGDFVETKKMLLLK